MAPNALTDPDFEQVSQYLQTQTVFALTPAAQYRELARAVHRLTHSLILWRFRLADLPTYGQVFVEELASDALQILPQVLLGYDKPFRLLTRGVIENVLRHIYFTDHPIEFLKMNTHPKWYLQVEELFTYAAEHPALSPLEKKFPALHKLRDLYTDLSAGVHGRRVQDFQMKIALEKLAFDAGAARKQEEILNKTVQSVNALLAAFHAAQFHRFGSADRSFILRTIPASGRAALSQIE